ncbi:hypothetical protein ACLK1G_11265 [Pseudomonas sp. NR3]|uniref:hypothetical protein n=1 Tax=Pseudomonas sp. NR3 TaxID=3155978 RepID=UPI003B673D4F
MSSLKRISVASLTLGLLGDPAFAEEIQPLELDAINVHLASHYKQGELWGFASEARPLNADGHTVNRRYRERDNNWHDSITQLEGRGMFDLGA